MRLLKEYPAIAAIIGIVIVILFSIVIILRGIRTPPDIQVFDTPDMREVCGRAHYSGVHVAGGGCVLLESAPIVCTPTHHHPGHPQSIRGA